MAERYQRQTVLPEVGPDGQAKLAAARVVVVGCGGLGSPAAAYLAGAGVGQLRLVDGDRPDITNLHRQVFFDPAQPGSKAYQLAGHLRRLNTEITIDEVASYVDAKNIRRLLSGATLVLDCTDDALTKHLLNDACVALEIPLVYAAAQAYAGYVALFPNAVGGINLRDLYAEPDPSLPDCATAGVLPTAVGIVAMLQANAALCYLLGIGNPPIERLLTYNALDNTQHRVKLQKTYSKPIAAPWGAHRQLARNELEIDADTLTPPGYDGIFSMLTETREPELPTGVVRLDSRNPFGHCRELMSPGGRYLLYCNSGKLSLVLAAQLRKAEPAVDVVSLRGGIKGIS
ncbi:adenylyltransferase/sulfurtransferase [Lewinella aquimaris]|uniref:Adenylyltransferase/sulfurtransferase n=1 Tax=Neolewinella aquimaris TaxID=1835722 RepID=A0A840E3M1_9BACT|nr:HesA/MoeB/ThiF family protein [Neolewinella aquimaris]MBB4078265.1 adenylyltransferase/sulfurtransferase [Neolewinella aquimaris]